MRAGNAWGDSTPDISYNLEDHLGTSGTRIEASGTPIDHEEYYPFGDSSLRTFNKKRYRYVGKERDNESGLYYYGTRYYAAWAGRFVSVDPLAATYAQLMPYNYTANNPIGDLDIDGMQSTEIEPSGGMGSPPLVPNELDDAMLDWVPDASAEAGGRWQERRVELKEFEVVHSKELTDSEKAEVFTKSFIETFAKALAITAIIVAIIVFAPLAIPGAVGAGIATGTFWAAGATGSYMVAEAGAKVLTGEDPWTGETLSDTEYWSNAGELGGGLAGGVAGAKAVPSAGGGAAAPKAGQKSNKKSIEAPTEVAPKAVVNETSFPLRRALTESETAEIRAISDRFNGIINVVGGRASGTGRNMDDPTIRVGKVKPGDPSRSDIDFKFDYTHPQSAEISAEFNKVGNGAASAGPKWSTHSKPTFPPYIRFHPSF